ncbi:Uncharacterised protein [Serratia fonticola]|uniref:Uncharacterized protein n=1 Tax=Serratia fonticola TaxID=47917 RepID=A0A4U9WJR9_SERFO|nr:Uncharacterised protein [Serratia fonticola]
MIQQMKSTGEQVTKAYTHDLQDLFLAVGRCMQRLFFLLKFAVRWPITQTGWMANARHNF